MKFLIIALIVLLACLCLCVVVARNIRNITKFFTIPVLALLGMWSCTKTVYVDKPILLPQKTETKTVIKDSVRVDTILYNENELSFLDTTQCPPSTHDTTVIREIKIQCPPSKEVRTTHERSETTETIKPDVLQLTSCLVMVDSLRAVNAINEAVINRLDTQVRQWRAGAIGALGVAILLIIISYAIGKWKSRQPQPPIT